MLGRATQEGSALLWGHLRAALVWKGLSQPAPLIRGRVCVRAGGQDGTVSWGGAPL